MTLQLMTHHAVACRLVVTRSVLAILISIVAPGCGGKHTELAAVSLGDTPMRFSCDTGVGTYTVDPAQVSIVTTDIKLSDLESGKVTDGRFLHVQLLWMPKAGKSPIVPEATNTCIRLLVISGGQCGIYGGGGFAWPIGRPGDEEFGLQLQGSNLTLLASTAGFHDLLSPAALDGTMLAKLDEMATRKSRRAASQLITNNLKAVRWVGAPAQGSASPSDLLLALSDMGASGTAR